MPEASYLLLLILTTSRAAKEIYPERYYISYAIVFVMILAVRVTKPCGDFAKPLLPLKSETACCVLWGCVCQLSTI